MMIFETHAHYNLSCFDAERETLFQQLQEAGVRKVVCPSVGFDGNDQMLESLRPYDWISFAIGIHPSRTPMYDWDDGEIEAGLRRQATQERVVAIGELGLDYHNGLEEHPDLIEREKLWFQRQLDIASDLALPLVLHVRSSEERPLKADEDALQILRAQSHLFSGVVHCFNSDYATACQYLDTGDYVFGIGGCLTYENMAHLREAVKKLPLDRIVLETDAPFVRPVGCTGKRNTSLNLPVIVKWIAELKGVSASTVEQVTFENAERVFFSSSSERG